MDKNEILKKLSRNQESKSSQQKEKIKEFFANQKPYTEEELKVPVKPFLMNQLQAIREKTLRKIRESS